MSHKQNSFKDATNLKNIFY